MQDRTYAVLRDSTKQFVLASEVQGWLNEANLELAKRLRVLRAAAGPTAMTNGQSTITLPNDFIEAETLLIGTGYVQFVTDPYFNVRLQIGGSPPATLARVFGNAVEINPAVTGTPTYTLRYIQSPPNLATGTDVSTLPASLHPKVVNYARAHAKYKEQEFEAGNFYMGLYEAGLPPPGAETMFSPFVPLQPTPGVNDLTGGGTTGAVRQGG